MEYEFINDPITGSARARFSLDHEIFGPWLEVEVGHNSEKMTELLTAIDNVSNKNVHEAVVVGCEYSAVIAKDDVVIKTNLGADEDDILPSDLLDQELDFDQSHQAGCGLEDFREMLKSWSLFIR